jgi:putative salt-induced outer membrane protein
MKSTAIKIFIFIFISLSTFAQTANDIFSKHIEATGGKVLWDSISTYSIKQAYRGNSAADYDIELKGSFNEAALYKAKTILKRTFIFGIKGAEGWRRVPLGSTDKATQYETNSLSEKEQENMRRELKENVLPFLDYQTKGYIATAVGSETLNGLKVTQVELSGKGIKYNLYFDETTGLLIRKKLSLNTGEVITEDYTKYSDTAYGIKFPSESSYLSSIDKRNLKVSTSAIFNDKIAPEYLTK